MDEIKSVVIRRGVTSIGDDAFAGCENLTSITIPDSVTRIGDGAFSYCHRLTGIAVDGKNQVYSSENGVLFDKKKTKLIRCPGGKTEEYVMLNSVTSIGERAFEDCRLTRIKIGNRVTSIGDDAFWGCDLTSITIPDSVTRIENGAFACWCATRQEDSGKSKSFVSPVEQSAGGILMLPHSSFHGIQQESSAEAFVGSFRDCERKSVKADTE